MTRRLSLALVLIFAHACGAEEREVRVVFSPSFIDVYGDLTIEVEGEGTFHLPKDGLPSGCDEPTLVTSQSTLHVNAASQQRFAWDLEVPLDDGECHIITLDHKNMSSGLLYVAIDIPGSEPWIISINDQVAGTITEGWDPRREIPRFEPPEVKSGLALEAAAAGRAVAVGTQESDSAFFISAVGQDGWHFETYIDEPWDGPGLSVSLGWSAE